MKRMISLCCAGLMAFSLAACGSQNAASSSTSTPQVTSAVVGKITALDGTTVTLQLGELTENQPGDPPSQDGAQPSGDNASGDSSASGQPQTPPEKTEGDNNTQGTGDGSSSTDAQNDPPSDGQGSAPGSTFTAGEETTTVDLSGATVTKESQSGTTDASLSDLAVGDVIEVTMGEDNTATAVVIKSVGGAPDGSGSGEVDQGTSANTIDKDGEVSGTTYTSDGDDENALRGHGRHGHLERCHRQQVRRCVFQPWQRRPLWHQRRPPGHRWRHRHHPGRYHHLQRPGGQRCVQLRQGHHGEPL